ncbi:FAD/NAD(P)-binding protein [Bradyrhizobium sp. NC92]|uniref:FAD/NAD(P)-binding protein n=1 Tax=Bradyrhizobium sp. (strain NC92) TaxID=55395 RepID=UPI0021AAC875|nr:FAD/NAD(P)-binding protein [Bradyrhizobium sp. NC92]UWU68203.1 FAD/NAD(P)-binding protein [Bradyrhizobium sp. NC92]
MQNATLLTSTAPFLNPSGKLDGFDPRHWIAFVGMGVGGASCFRSMLKKATADRITGQIGFICLDMKPISQQGRGVAWAPDQAPFILANMHLPKMSNDPENPHALLEALGVDGDNLSQDAAFFKRSEIGEAFSKDLDLFVEVARHAGVPVVRLQGEAARLDRLGQGFAITLSGGGQLFANTVVLALGHVPSTNFKHLDGSPKYIGNPWDFESLKAIPADAQGVCVLGLGPTAVDTINILRHQNGVKQIHAYSRSGCMQYPRPRYHRHELKVLTREAIKEMAAEHGGLTWKDILRGISREFKVARIDCSGMTRAFENARLHPKRAIPLGLADCHEDSEWFSVLKAFDDVTPLIWHLLPPGEREVYKRDYRQAHTNVSYGSASKVAKDILDWLDDGSLTVAGGLGEVHFAEGLFHVKRRSKDFGEEVLIHLGFEYLVNCSGIGTGLSKARYPLLGYLLRKGWLTPMAEGGAMVDFHSGQLLTPDGKPVGEVYSLAGSITYGTHLLTHCLDQVVGSAIRTADAIHEKLMEAVAPERV